ncbi:MAG: type II secretion system F family protein [Gemmata sp.]
MDRLNGKLLAHYGPLIESVGASPAVLPVLLRWWRAATAAVFLAFWFWVQMPPVAIFTAFVTNAAGPLALDWWVAARRKRIGEQTVTAARNLAGQVRVGMSMNEALAEVAREIPEPLGAILRRTVGRLDAGASVRDVLTDLRARIRVDAVALMSIALLVAAEKGGKLGEVLTRISFTLEELQRVTRKRDTDTAAGRLMVLIMAVFPFAFVALFSFMDPQLMHALFNTLAGQGVLAVVGALVYLSTRWASRILSKVE